MKKLVKLLLDKFFIRLVLYIYRQLPDSNSINPNSVYYRIKDRALQSSTDFVDQHLNEVLLFPHREQLWKYAINKINNSEKGLYLEFGVYKAVSINYFSSKLPKVLFHGFDSFIGLQEDWKGTKSSKGRFDLQGNLPKVNKNVKLYEGYFDQTLIPFLQKETANIDFIHIDSDTYEAATYILNNLKNRLQLGTILVFDEFLGYPNWQNGEFKAWNEFVKKEKIEYEFLAFSNEQVCIRIN